MSRRLSTSVVVGLLSAVVIAAGPPSAQDVRGDIARAAITLPSDNQIANASFETDTSGWGATNARLTRAAVSGAPEGIAVASAAWTGSGTTMSLWTTLASAPLTAASSAYTATVQVTGANAAARGRKARLVLREMTSAGTTVRSWAGPQVTLGSSWSALTARSHGLAAGHRMRLVVELAAPGSGAVLQADAATERVTAELPLRNTLTDPTIGSTSGWTVSGGTFSSIRNRSAADGGQTGRLTAAGTAPATVRRSGSSVTSDTGRWRAQAYVAAPGTAVQVQVQVLEIAAGKTVATHTSPSVSVTSGARPITFEANVAAGRTLVLAITMVSPSAGRALDIDAVSLAPAGSTLGAYAITADDHNHLGDTSRYRYVVLHYPDSSQVADLHAANALTRGYVYMDAAITRKRSCGLLDGGSSWTATSGSYISGVDYCWLLSHHPEWILRTANGAPATYVDYPDYVVLDVANAGLQATYASGIVSTATKPSVDFDGIYMDDTNLRIGHGLQDTPLYRQTSGGLAPYDTSHYGDDMVSFITGIRSGLKSTTTGAALDVMANVQYDPWDAAMASQARAIAAQVDVFDREHQAQWLGGSSYCGPFRSMEPNALRDLQSFATQVQAGAPSYGSVEYTTSASAPTSRDVTLMQFTRASWLLAWDGEPGGATVVHPCVTAGSSATIDNPAWTTEVGLPTGATEVVRSAQVIWQAGDDWPSTVQVLSRRFTGGIALLNTYGTAQTVLLDGTYRDTSGRVWTGSITLPAAVPVSEPYDAAQQGVPGSGAVLTRVSY